MAGHSWMDASGNRKSSGTGVADRRPAADPRTRDARWVAARRPGGPCAIARIIDAAAATVTSDGARRGGGNTMTSGRRRGSVLLLAGP